MDLSGKTCFVTAAGQGIGRASALAMAEAGARVIATDVNAEALERLTHNRIETQMLDVMDAEAITAAAAAASETDVLFNCAGFVAHGTLMDCDQAQWDFSIALNVTAMYQMCRAFLPGMVARGGGSIINMSSVVSTIVAAPNRFAYGTTKGAVIGMTKAIAADFVTDGIRCNAICPGTVQTPSLEQRLTDTGDYDKARAAFIARQPIGRLATAEEIAGLVVYLASDSAAYTTGTAQIIDGAWSNT